MGNEAAKLCLNNVPIQRPAYRSKTRKVPVIFAVFTAAKTVAELISNNPQQRGRDPWQECM